MSLKVKLKRAFLKAHKFLIVTVVIFVILCSSCLPALAETRFYVENLKSTNSNVVYLTSDGSATDTYSFNNVIFQSPFGGEFYAVALNIHGVHISNVQRVYGYTYFDNSIYLKAKKEFTISGYYVLPWDKLFRDGSFNLTYLNIVLRSTQRDFLSFELESALDPNSWQKKLVSNQQSAYFGFFYFKKTFVLDSNETLKSIFFDYRWNLADLPGSGGYYGFSDLNIAYEYDALTEKEYAKPDNSAIDEHNNLANNIENDTQAGLGQAVDSMTLDTNNNYFISMIDGVLLFKDILDLAFTKLPFYNVLLEFSLALGIFAFLLGLSIYAVGHIGKSGKGNRKGGGG